GDGPADGHSRDQAGAQSSASDRGQAQGGGQSPQGQGGGQGQGQGQQGQSGQGDQGDQPGSGAGTGSNPRITDVYDPAATRARQVQVPGGDFDRPQIGQGGDQSDGGDGEVTVDYRDVLPIYQ